MKNCYNFPGTHPSHIETLVHSCAVLPEHRDLMSCTNASERSPDMMSGLGLYRLYLMPRNDTRKVKDNADPFSAEVV